MLDREFDSLEDINKTCTNCSMCGLSTTRKNTVFGDGNTNADIMFIGEGPGEQEDIQGKPFVGQSGKLLTRMLNAIELSRDEVYITNIVKCRPPGNRDPHEEEKAACKAFLINQLKIINPKIVVCLGRIASQAMIDNQFRITVSRGIWFKRDNYDLIATFHPSALLRDVSKKSLSWEDFKKIKLKLKELRG